MTRIVVGLDGSEHGAHALAWAAAHTRAAGGDLHVVTAVSPPMLGDPMMGYWVIDEAHSSRIAKLQAEMVSDAKIDDIKVTCERPEGQAARSLLDRARDAALLVVGTHGHGALTGAIMGSITHQLATHTPCPMVSVPDERVAVTRIVVGVDGSPSATRALEWAAAVARHRGATLELVAVYDAMMMPITSPWVPTLVTPEPAQLRKGMSAMLDEVVAGVDLTEITVERTILEGRASARLQERAADADLLVVGSRGHGGFHGLLLGSTSHGALRHPPCAVAVIPGGD